MDKKQQIELNNFIGSRVTGVCEPLFLLYPRDQTFQTMESGRFGLVKVLVTSVADGKIPDFLDGIERGTYELVLSGYLPKLDENKRYYFTFEVEKDPKYLYKCKLLELNEAIKLDTKEDKMIFLSSFIPEKTLKKLYEGLEDPFQTLKDGDLHDLTDIDGIGYKTAQKLVDEVAERLSQTGKFLILRGKYGLTDIAIGHLLEKYKTIDTIISKLKEDPYILTEVKGFGWKKVDELAMKNGYDPIGYYRIKSYIEYFLSERAQNEGDSWVYLPDLVHAVKEEIPQITNPTLVTYIQNLTGRNDFYKNEWEIPLHYEEKDKKIGLKYFWDLENKLKYETNRLLKAKPIQFHIKKSIEDVIKECEIENGWEYTKEQIEAIHGCLDNNMYIVTAPSGCGKTSIMKPIARYCKENGIPVAQTALSGRAASNLTEITNIEGKTIHRLLSYNPEKNIFRMDARNPLLECIIIIDEVSMNDNELLYYLLRAVRDGAKVIMLGDCQQLDPLGTGAFLRDALDTEAVPHIKLTKIQRQAQKSAIITESLKISRGEQIAGNKSICEVRGELQDLKIVTYQDSEASTDIFIREYKTLLNKGIQPKDIVGIVPMKSRGKMSCLPLNNEIQKIVNGDISLPGVKVGEKESESYVIRLGDRVINRKNHYDTVQYLGPNKMPGEMEPIYNGNIGTVIKITDDYMIIDFKQQGKIMVKKGYWKDIMLGYVCSGHSFQGSQMPYVVCGIDMGCFTLLSREWEYTALTRAKKYCTLVAQASALRKAISTSKIKEKHTWLKQLWTKR